MWMINKTRISDCEAQSIDYRVIIMQCSFIKMWTIISTQLLYYIATPLSMLLLLIYGKNLEDSFEKTSFIWCSPHKVWFLDVELGELWVGWLLNLWVQCSLSCPQLGLKVKQHWKSVTILPKGINSEFWPFTSTSLWLVKNLPGLNSWGSLQTRPSRWIFQAYSPSNVCQQER